MGGRVGLGLLDGRGGGGGGIGHGAPLPHNRDGIHAHAVGGLVIAAQGNGAGGEAPAEEVQRGISGHQRFAGGGKGCQPGRFGRNTLVMGAVHSDGLVDLEGEEAGPLRGFVVVGGLDIGGIGQGSGHSGVGEGAVGVDGGPRLEAVGDDLVDPAAGHGQVGNFQQGGGAIGDGDGDGGGGRGVPSGIAGDRGQGVGAGRDSGGIPDDLIVIGGVFGAQVGAIELELDAKGADVIGGKGSESDGAGDSGAIGGSCQGDSRGEGIQECGGGGDGGRRRGADSFPAASSAVTV